MAPRRSSLATSARWEVATWTLALVLAVTGFWPLWAFHSGTGTFVWLVFVVVVFAAVMAARAPKRHR